MRIRSALSIQRDVIFALFLRSLRERFSGHAFGNVWLILEPLLLMGIFLALLGARGRGELGYAEPPVFILAGVVAFRQLWQPTMRQVMSSVKAFRSLRMFRQISVLDLMIAQALMQGVIYLAVAGLFIIGLLWFGFQSWPDDPLMVFAGSLATWFFGIGIGIIFAVSTYFGPELQKFINLLQLPLMLMSAVLYPMTLIPEPYRSWLAYNPLVHASEWLREYWVFLYVSPVLDEGYLLGWTVCTLAFGVASMRLTRHRELMA